MWKKGAHVHLLVSIHWYSYKRKQASLMAQLAKKPPVTQETLV